MTENGSIRLEGLQELLRMMGARRVEVNRAAAEGLKRAGAGIIADGQRNLRQNTSWVTGQLANSVRVVDNGDEGLDTGFFDQRSNSEGYASYVEYGRRAGKMPPPAMLGEWVYKKLRVRDRKAATSIGWAMAVNIARRGTRPHPFFIPAVNKWKSRIVRVITEATRRVIEKSS